MSSGSRLALVWRVKVSSCGRATALLNAMYASVAKESVSFVNDVNDWEGNRIDDQLAPCGRQK